ncbi:MAG TPA: DUF5677 domain-containing protein [Terriglobales bacterium]|nr:DUF5677 domain-containing protein [Terriglobales bacterium]
MENPSGTNTTVSAFGFADEVIKFDQRHPLYRARMSRLAAAIDLAFTRIQPTTTPEEKFVYFYGTLVAEDFMEIYLVAVNGYGAAATKLLRSMYEHTVTLRYLHDHPDEVGAFIEYNRVQEYKLMQPILDTFGADALPPETIAEVKRKYEEVKEQFMVTDCKKCGTKKVNHTWSKLHFAAMAKKSGVLGTVLVPGYFLPLRHAHSTFAAMTDRMKNNDGLLSFHRESQPKLADDALRMAHNCLLMSLEIQDERFKIAGLKAAIENCVRDWAEIWAPDAPFLKDAG